MPYTPTVWTSAMPITVARLNNIEAGIQAAPANSVDTAALVANAVTVLGFSPLPSNFITSSTSYVDTGLSVTLTTTGGPLICLMTGRAYPPSGNYVYVALQVNGVDYMVHSATSTENLPPYIVLTGIPAGTHAIKVRLRSGNSGSSATLSGTESGSTNPQWVTRLAVIELKR